MENFHFGENLEKIRKEKQIKQDYMANQMGFTQGYLSKIEGESHVPNDEFVKVAAAYLEISERELLPPSWFVKTIKRKVSVLTAPAHGIYIFLIVCCAIDWINGISNWQERSLPEKILIIIAFVAAGFALYRLTVRRREITEVGE